MMNKNPNPAQKVVSSLTSLSFPKKKKSFPIRKSNRRATDPLRVGIICPYSMSVPGGVQNQVLLMSKELRQRGIDARIIAPCDGVPPTDYFYSVGTTKALKSNGSLAPIADDASSASLTMDAIESFRPDVLHLHEPLVPGPTTAAMIGAEYPIVATFHAAGESNPALKYFRHPARGAISRIHLKIAVSNEAKNMAKQYLKGEYEIIPNCVDTKHIFDHQKWPSTKAPVLFVGRHEERKGLKFLIQAWKTSELLQKKYTLWVAGNGPETPELVNESKHIDSISFLGRIDNDELFRRMRSAYVVVAPALYGESFGIVLVEAMAANACVVATDIPGYRDVARNNIEAILVSPSNSEELRIAIEKIMSNTTFRNQLQKAGLARAKEFSVHNIVDKYVIAYTKAISEHKASND
ncbi:MAG: glycosyltransferase family 4 protein [Acidimicrobiia bacterium]